MTAAVALAAPSRGRLAQLRGRMDGFASSGLIVIGVRIAGAGLALGAQVLAARYVGAEAFGQYALILVWLLLLGHGSTAGTSQLICRFLSTYHAEGDGAAAAGLLRFAAGLALGVAAFTAALSVAVVRSGYFDLDPDMVALATLAFCVVPLLVLQDVLESIARGLDKPHLGIAPAILLRHTAIAAGVAAMMLLGREGDAVTIMSFTVAGLCAAIAVQYALLRASLRQALAGARPRYHNRLWFRTALPLCFLDAVDLLFLNADILILGLLVPPEIVAFYFAATRLSQILAYVPYGISAATAQKYAPLAARGDRAALQTLISQATALSAGLAGAAGLVLAVAAPLLLAMFGESYDIAAPAVIVLSLGIVVKCALGPGDDVLNMLGEERICSAVFLVAVAANVALNFALIPFWGIFGAAAATVMALALRGALLAYFAHRRLGLALPLGTRRLLFRNTAGETP